MGNDTDVARRTFLKVAAAAATFVASPPSALAQATSGAPPEIATAGRPQGTDKFGATVDNLPVIDAHIHLFGPASKYPFAPDTFYHAHDALPETNLALQDTLGVSIR